MKRLLYIVILAAVLLIPEKGTDVGKLIPVEVIAVSKSAGLIHVETDTGNSGTGTDLYEAFADMEDTASGIIYLDTAEYALLEDSVAPESLVGYLKDSVRICIAQEGISLDEIADYLSAHQPGVRLDKVTEIEKLPSIEEENGRYRLVTE